MVLPIVAGMIGKKILGKVGKKVLGGAKKVLGMKGGRGGSSGGRGRRHRWTIDRGMKQLVKAKIQGKINNAKYGALLRAR